MEARLCDHCGTGMETEGIRHRRRLFCSDECCEEFEDRFMEKGEPDEVDLGDDFEDDIDLGDDDDLERLDDDSEVDPLDDDF